MNSNDTEAMVKAAEDLLRMEAINSTQWRTLSEKVADFAAEQIATQTAELQKRLAEAEAIIDTVPNIARTCGCGKIAKYNHQKVGEADPVWSCHPVLGPCLTYDQLAQVRATERVQLANALAEIKRLREALDQWECVKCHGKGCSLCGDSTYDHYFFCDSESRVCKTCGGTGKHPLAQQALEQENQQEEKDVTAG